MFGIRGFKIPDNNKHLIVDIFVYDLSLAVLVLSHLRGEVHKCVIFNKVLA